ncbi:hypothetical protein HS088_TW19G00475 [Tripterygium wilfordii]|uniref:G-patch domain-containing protein n=1 Tax=Tripterygium wilfordii TaxID=458696 RepID=A0A7J7C9R2_TRIWF|nr:uncharacterized protein LOC119984950 isoform X2 [Tripterygium wilfordii]KAF5730873.1 hypothetical protein HS088_TW19G00475 [Tripterygium wilfordii]
MSGSEEGDCSFVWGEANQLYFHASSGFYHDPKNGWYYSSSDGLYYKFEDGNYVLLESEKVNECETYQCKATHLDHPVQDQPCTDLLINSEDKYCTFQPDSSEADQFIATVSDEHTSGYAGCHGEQPADDPPRPSEWLEETLINLYLCNYNVAADATDDAVTTLETNSGNDSNLSADVSGTNDTQELEEGEWIPEDNMTALSQTVIDEGAMRDEEMWQAQYGQVVRDKEESVPNFPVVDLWDWEMVTASKKDGKGKVAKLVGRLVRRSAKLHPSMPSGGRLLKTAPICEVHLDLVRVTTGQVYRLRSPSVKYLASVSTYDSSNPTLEWGFPELSVKIQRKHQQNSCGRGGSRAADGFGAFKDAPIVSNKDSACGKDINHAYRDRAAERRTLHGGFGVGPGQKNPVVGDDGDSSLGSTNTEDAAAEALNKSFGAGSYARRILEGMGWKEGEALGHTSKGLKEPIQLVGNTGVAGLGYPQGKRRHL